MTDALRAPLPLAAMVLVGGFVVPILVLAAAAAFIAYRLYSVLGNRTGHEQTLAAPVEPHTGGPVRLAGISKAPSTGPGEPFVEPRAEAALRLMAARDASVTPTQFIEGARGAYRMVLEAFWRGDKDELAEMVSDDVLASFAAAIDARENEGLKLDNRLISIERTQILDASVESQLARITVRFEADIATVTRNAQGDPIAGSLTDAVSTRDVWTFARPLRNSDPNWLLIETDEAA